jgi:hypothetical protein
MMVSHYQTIAEIVLPWIALRFSKGRTASMTETVLLDRHGLDFRNNDCMAQTITAEHSLDILRVSGVVPKEFRIFRTAVLMLLSVSK